MRLRGAQRRHPRRSAACCWVCTMLPGNWCPSAASAPAGTPRSAHAEGQARRSSQSTKPPFAASAAKSGRWSRSSTGNTDGSSRSWSPKSSSREWTPDGQIRHAAFAGLARRQACLGHRAREGERPELRAETAAKEAPARHLRPRQGHARRAHHRCLPRVSRSSTSCATTNPSRSGSCRISRGVPVRWCADPTASRASCSSRSMAAVGIDGHQAAGCIAVA